MIVPEPADNRGCQPQTVRGTHVCIEATTQPGTRLVRLRLRSPEGREWLDDLVDLGSPRVRRRVERTLVKRGAPAAVATEAQGLLDLLSTRDLRPQR
jgi:hypothetical protein